MGGAARFLDELKRWLSKGQHPEVRLVGEGRSLSPHWLVRRDLTTRSDLRVALNNVSFVGRGERRTLLRNALHWLTDDERAQHAAGLPRSFAAEVRIVRATARRADRLVVPCSAMADRVASVAPHLAGRLVVRHHPLTALPPPDASAPREILVPVLLAGYKRMDRHLAALLDALDRVAGPEVRVRVTARADDVPAEVGGDPRVDLLGPLSTRDIAEEWRRAAVVYYPTGLESFGYPLAEARASGRHVVAQDSAQNQEIAGPALRGFTVDDPDSLAAAVDAAVATPLPRPDPAPFDPDGYFRDLLDAS
jgi:glycosyltransferase involved in cell wall biosynthesis